MNGRGITQVYRCLHRMVDVPVEHVASTNIMQVGNRCRSSTGTGERKKVAPYERTQ